MLTKNAAGSWMEHIGLISHDMRTLWQNCHKEKEEKKKDAVPFADNIEK